MAVVNLTGTKWLLNSSLDLSIKTAYTINFVSNNINYAYFAIGAIPSSKDPVPYSLAYYTSSSTIGNSVYGGYVGEWTNEAYRTIEITGGTDATNATLITWLENNATQVGPEPLPIRSISLENLNTFKEELELEMSSMALPTTTVAGKVLKSTSTAGTVEWGNDTNTNYYHSTGTWSGLTYTATANGGTSCPELKFTIPTGTTSTTVAAGNHTHSSLKNGSYTASLPTLSTTDTIVTLKTAQIFSGTKTFSTGPVLSNNISLLGRATDAAHKSLIKIDSSNITNVGNTTYDTKILANAKVYPDSDNARDLGSSSYRWKDIYLSGSLKDGTNSITVANIASKSDLPIIADLTTI